MHRAYRIYFFELSMYYIVSILVLIAILTLYYMYFALDELKIREKSANVFYDSLFLKTKVVEKVTKTRKVKKTKHKKEYNVKGFHYSRAQVLKIVEIYILKKLVVANGEYEIEPIAEHKGKKYILINFEMNLKCSFFQLIQLFEVLEKFAITISDFSITPQSHGNSDISISFTAPAYEE